MDDSKISRVTFTRQTHLHSIEDPNSLRLRINRVSLVQQLNVDPIVEQLWQEKILSDGDIRLIQRGSSKPDRTRLLLDILPTKDQSTQWYAKFRESLQKSGQSDVTTQKQHAMLVAFMDNTIVQRPLQMPKKAAQSLHHQPLLVEAAGKRIIGRAASSPLPEILAEAESETGEHKALWKVLKTAANAKMQQPTPTAVSNRLDALPPHLVAAYMTWRSDKSEALLSREKEALKRIRAADRYLATCEKQQQQQQPRRLICLYTPVKRLLKDAKYSHMAFKHVNLLANRYLVDLAPALATAYAALASSFSGWSPFAARKLARHGFRLFDFLEGLCEFRLCEKVAASLAEFAKRGSGLESLVPGFRASVRLMEARLNNGQLPLADAARLAANEVVARIVKVSFGQEILNQSELLVLSGRLLLEQGSLLPAQTCFTAALNKVELTNMHTVFKILFYSLDVYLIRYEEIKAEKLAVACVQHAHKFFKPHSPQYVKSLINYVKFSNTFKRDAFGVEVATNAVLFAHTVMGYEHPLLAEAQSLLALARLLAAAEPQAAATAEDAPQELPPVELALTAVQTGQDAYPTGHPLLASLMVNFGQAVLLAESRLPGELPGRGAPHPLRPAALSHCQLAAATLSEALGERSPATVRARLVLGQLLALAGEIKLAGEQLRRAHRALARVGGGPSAEGKQQVLPQQARSHAVLIFLLNYAKFLRQSGQAQQAILLARQVAETTECYGAYIPWVDEAFALVSEILADAKDAAASQEAAKRRSDWLAGHPVYRSRLDWQTLHNRPDKNFFKKFNLWTESKSRIMGQLKKQRKAEAEAAAHHEDGAKRLKQTLKDFSDDSEERFCSSSSSSSSDESASGDKDERKDSKRKAPKKRKDLVRFKTNSSASSESSDSDVGDEKKPKDKKDKQKKEKKAGKKKEEKQTKKKKEKEKGNSSSSSSSESEDEIKIPKVKNGKDAKPAKTHKAANISKAEASSRESDVMPERIKPKAAKEKGKPGKEGEQQPIPTKKVIIIGDSGVGKSNLTTRIAKDTFDIDSRRTIGVEFCAKTLRLKGRDVKCQIWDTAGKEIFRSITGSYYRGANCIMLVYDVTNRASFDSCSRWLDELRQMASPDAAVMLVGNKADLLKQQPPAVTKKEAKRFAETHGIAFAKVSAFNSDNSVAKAFKQLVKLQLGDDGSSDSSSSDGEKLRNGPKKEGGKMGKDKAEKSEKNKKSKDEKKKQKKKKKKKGNSSSSSSRSSSSDDEEKQAKKSGAATKKAKEIHNSNSDILQLHGSG